MASDDEQSDAARQLATRRPAYDFSLVLLKTIESIKNDPAQFRNLVYEMARVHLQKEAWHQDPPMNILEMRRLMLALETAIERVETTTSQRDGMPMLAPAELAVAGAHRALSTHDAIVLIDQPPVAGPPVLTAPTASAQSRFKARVPAPLKAIARLGALAVLAAVIVIVADRQFHWLGPAAPPIIQSAAAPTQKTASAPSVAAPSQFAAAPPSSPSGPLPSVYGVYAVSGGKLFELESLVGRVPDQRVFMSTMIKTPSRTLLPDGQVTFVVYRRDITSSAPDRVTVRVVAKVVRAITFDKAGRAGTVAVDDAWAIRNLAFDYRVAPSADSPEMIAITPENDAAVLPPGRYGLVIKGLAYDFTVDGPVTGTTQCLERTDAANGSFYSECPTL